MILREREREGGRRRGSEMAEEDVKKERERMIIYSLIRVIQDIKHKYIKH